MVEVRLHNWYRVQDLLNDNEVKTNIEKAIERAVGRAIVQLSWDGRDIMTVEEVRQRKLALEAEIREKLQKFIDETGVDIEAVHVQTVHSFGKKVGEIYSVSIEAKV